MLVTIKTSLFIFLAFILFAAQALAESKYISEDFEVTLRTGPGSDRKIISLIPSGRAVEVINAGEEWSQVAYNGKTGWVLTRYLTNKVPTALVLERLQKNHKALLEQKQALDEKLAQLSSQNQGLSQELKQTQNDLTQVNTTYESLKSESSEYLKLKSKYEKAVKDMKSAQVKADKIESDFIKLSSSELNKGMLYGGGLVFVGFIIGFILKRPKRRTPLL
jgi:SH3 domain protein